MNPILLVVVILFGAITAFVLGAAYSYTPAPKKRFGLKESENAVSYVEAAASAVASFLPNEAAREAVKRATAQAMAGSAVGLGYENVVASDLTNVAADTVRLNDEARGEIMLNNQEIADLKRNIVHFQAVIDSREEQLAEKKRVAALFAAAA